MADNFDSAVGAVLEIPTEALQAISNAEKRIKRLGEVSNLVAENVRKDWAITAVSGLSDFITKIGSAEQALQKIGKDGINFNINTNVAQQNLESLSSQTKKTETDISTVAQQSSKFLDQIDFSRPKESFEQLKITFGELEKELNNLISGRKATEVGSPEAQALNNIIASLRDYINLQKQSNEEKDKAIRKQADDTILKEQRILLERILQLTKDINAEELKQARYKELGRAIPQEDINRLDEYKTKLIDTAQAYSTLSERIGEMSEKGAKAFNDAEIKAQLAATREETKAQENLNQALQQTAKLTSETKLKAPGISSREEAAYASQLVAVYQQMIQLKKMEGDMQAKIATQGYAQTAAQTDYLNQITAEYHRLESTLTNVSGKYAEIDRVAKSNFERSLTLQEAENATKLADAYQKAAEAAEKKRKAESKSEQVDLSKDKAEYKKVLTLIEQLEKAQRKLNQALAQANLPSNLSQQLQSALQASESSLNTLYNRRSQLEAERGNELIEIQRQQEVKKAENAIAEHDKAEKEKTRISKEQAQERYNEEMRQKRLENQDLTAQGKRQRMQINDAKERRQWEMERVRREEIERLRREIEALDKTDANYQKNLDRLNQRINELLGTQQRRVQYTAEEARNMAKTATNLNQLENAYRALKDAMSTLDPKSKEWQELNKLLHEVKPKIDQIKRSMGEFQSQARRTGDLMDGLKGKIAAAFSIAAISGFIKKVVETRAQFELQRIALGAIIQDTDKANKTFLQIQQMALESPFSIMQLERATKQIAAFGFEADKLLPTMKMLGDMSAGLGVEIDRLILVMGHLKARNYLEGTMVRQFTNAGFNVLGELSKYYSELEGKMVSVAEVQTRVKKKMVEFADVEEVLKRVTSAGGMFYDMQKKQADSLWGQLQRITDAYDLMLNEIGKDNQNIISQALTAVRSLIQHWRILAPTIKAVGWTMAAVFAAKGIGALLIGLTKFHRLLTLIPALLTKITTGIKTMNVAWATTGVGALVAGVSILASVIAGAYAEAKALNSEINHIQEEGEAKMFTLIYKYRELADAVSSSTKSYAEKDEALKELKRTYGKILPAEMLEIENIKKITDGYGAATDAIREYMNEQMRVNAREAVDKETRTAYSEWQNRLAKRFAKGLIDWNNIDTNESEMKGRIKAITDQIYQEIMNGNLKAEDGLRRFRELFKQYYGMEDLPRVTNAFASMWESKWWDIAQIGKDSFKSIFEDYADFITEVEERFNDALTKMQADQMMEATPKKDQYTQLTKAVEKYSAALRSLKDVVGTEKISADGSYEIDSLTQSQKEALGYFDEQLEAVNKLRAGLGLLPISYDEVKKAMESNMEAEKALREQTLETYRAQLDQIEEFARAANNNALVGWVENVRKKLDETDLSDVQKEIQKVIDDVEDLNNINLGNFRWAIIDSSTTVSEARTNVKKELDALKENVKEYQASIAAGMAPIVASMLHLQGKSIEEVNRQVESLELVWKRLGGHEKDKKSGKDPILEQWKNRLDALKRYYDAAEKARKHLDERETRAEQEDAFKKLWADLKFDKLEGLSLNDLLAKGFDPKKLQSDYVGAMEQLLKYVPEKYGELRTKIQEQISSESIEIKFKVKEEEEENLKRQLDEMFDSYELTKQLKDVGLNVDLTYMLGGRPTTLENIQKEIDRLSLLGDEDAKNRIKHLEDAQKKLLDMQLKEMKNRVNDYAKYLKNAYGESARVQLEYYTKLTQMEGDYKRMRIEGEKKLKDPNISAKERSEIEKMLAILPEQSARVAYQMKVNMQKELDKINLDKLLKSPLFAEMFQDLGSMTNSVLDKMAKKIDDIQKSANDLSLSQVRQLAQYAEKIQNAKIDNSPFVEAYNAIKKAYELRAQGITAKSASESLAVSEEELEKLEILKEDINFILGIKEGIYTISGNTAIKEGEHVVLTEQQQSLLQQTTSELNEQLGVLNDQSGAVEGSISAQKKVVTQNAQNVQTFKNAKTATEKWGAALQEAAKVGQEAINVVVAALQVFGKEIGEDDQAWLDFVSNMLSTCITLGLAFVALGVEINSALGIIGIIALALSAVAGLLTAIFKAHDAKLQKQIEKLQDEVDKLDKAFQRLQKSIERAFTMSSENKITRDAISNLKKQKEAYQQMIRLEDEKKKSDDDKIREYKEKIEELDEALEELYETRHEKWGSTNDVWGEANNWVDAWLDAFKETGDGLDSLNESWDEFYENLVKKQAVSKVLGARMNDWIDKINKAIDSNMDEYGMVDMFKQLGEQFKKEFGNANELLKQFFEYAGIGNNNGEYLLSDLQKGIQNITEPQAAAIEAYLNSMRFAVFRHTEQLDILITTIQAQYGAGESPMLQEVRLIRSVVESINTQLSRVIVNKNANTNYVLKVG